MLRNFIRWYELGLEYSPPMASMSLVVLAPLYFMAKALVAFREDHGGQLKWL